jgi:hypothetical protein
MKLKIQKRRRKKLRKKMNKLRNKWIMYKMFNRRRSKPMMNHRLFKKKKLILKVILKSMKKGKNRTKNNLTKQEILNKLKLTKEVTIEDRVDTTITVEAIITIPNNHIEALTNHIEEVIEELTTTEAIEVLIREQRTEATMIEEHQVEVDIITTKEEVDM